MAEPFEFSEIQADHILDMQLRRLTRLARTDLEEETRRACARRSSSSRRSSTTRAAQRRHQATRSPRSRTSSPRPACARSTFDDGDIDIEDLIDDEELVVVMTAGQYVKTVAADTFRTQGRGGRGVARRQAERRGLRHVIFTTAHAYLLFFSNRGQVYRLKAHEIPSMSAPPRACRSSTCCRCSPTSTSRRSSTPATTRRTVPVLRHQERHGQEDHVQRLRLEPPRRPDRHQPARRRRAGAGHRDQRQRRHLHGEPQRHDDPLQRGRRAAHGSRRRRCARHEAASRRRSCRLGRRRPRRHRHLDHHRRRLRQAHAARQVQPSGPRRPGRRGIKLTGKKGAVVAAFMVGLDDEIVAVSNDGVTIRMAVREHLLAGSRRHGRQGDEHRRRRRRRFRRARSSLPTTPESLPPRASAPHSRSSRSSSEHRRREWAMARAVGDRGQAAMLLIVVASVMFLMTHDGVGRARRSTWSSARVRRPPPMPLPWRRSTVAGPAAEVLAARHGAELVSWVRGPARRGDGGGAPRRCLCDGSRHECAVTRLTGPRSAACVHLPR